MRTSVESAGVKNSTPSTVAIEPNPTFIVSTYKHLPTRWKSKLWCWQYRMRKSIARIFKVWKYRHEKALRPKPILR